MEYQTSIGVASGRSAYRASQQADAIIGELRRLIAELIGTPHRDSIALTTNGTMALNAAILGFLHEPTLEGIHVVTTVTEHNSVLRPLSQLERTRGLQWTAVPCDREGFVHPHALRSAMQPNTRLMIINHGSNVTGTIQDLEHAVSIAHSFGAAILVDTAQTLGFVQIDVAKLGIDMLAAPLHKGACGMLGTGFLFANPELADRLRIPWIGGTGRNSDSLLDDFPWRDAVESGNLNVPALASVSAGIRWLNEFGRTIPLSEWTGEILKTLHQCNRIRWFGPTDSQSRLPVFSMASETLDCHELAMILDSSLGIEARSGFHCAALMHSALDTQRYGGTLRLSLGHTSTESDVAHACDAIRCLDSL
jgi:cysteine desulfurase / selenocysteine lyase